MSHVLHGRAQKTVQGDFPHIRIPPNREPNVVCVCSQLDTVCRVLLDRKWTVGELAAATLQNAQHVLEAPGDAVRRSECLFEKLIGLY